MSQVVESREALPARIGAFLSQRRRVLRDYAAALGGTAGRLIFSLVYFVLLANTLSIADFGVFATASAAGVVLSRIVGFGFIASLYRVATVRPRLLGTFTAGFLLMTALSLPVLGAATWLMHWLFFSAALPLAAFATVIAAEALLWRPVEAVIIVNNGLGQFLWASLLTILGTVLRAAAALLFMMQATPSLESWTIYYLAANAVALVVAVTVFQPRVRLRLRPRFYWKRLPDSLYVAGAEILFYLQMEFDKFLVLSMGGAKFAGIYAIIMRLVDLTAIPVRTFNMMLVQKMMRMPDLLASLRARGGIELLIFLASTACMVGIATILHLYPRALGGNVAQASGLLVLALLVPGLRNLAEYQAELLFARGQTALRAMNLALLGSAKAIMLAFMLIQGDTVADLVIGLNVVFAALYAMSTLLTYSAMRLPAKRI